MHHMYCYQCEQTSQGTGCTTLGVCGKDPNTTKLQDVMVHICKGIAQYAHRSRELGGSLPEAVQALSARLGGEGQLHFSDQLSRVALFVSKQDHCLLDLLWRTRAGELPMQVPLVISNHPDLRAIAEDFGARFELVPVSAESKQQAEQRQLELLAEEGIDLAVLAKYMQVLSGDFLSRFSPVINIHHSFLPAFTGAQPYHRAWERGVKLIGATAHYVTEELDAGPIIEQATVHVSHRDEVHDLIRKGRDMERLALARALRQHLHHQVMVYRGRTAVFD